MSKDWIIEVLGDLRGFAKTNDLPILADQLDEAVAVAVAEISQARKASARKEFHGKDRRHTGTFG